MIFPPRSIPQICEFAIIDISNSQISSYKTPTPYLVKYVRLRYSLVAAAKTAAGRRNPGNLLAAPRFACAVALTHPLQMRLLYCVSKISMVTQTGQPSGWSVPSRTDIPTPVWVTTQERRNSGGSILCNLLEAALWLRSST